MKCNAYLCSDMVKDGQQHTVKHTGPEGGCEGRSMEAECVKQDLQSTVPAMCSWFLSTV